MAINAVKALEDNNAVLLANHGIITCENSLSKAYNVLREIEYCSKLHVIAKSAGSPYILEDDEMDIIIEKFKGYGQ